MGLVFNWKLPSLFFIYTCFPSLKYRYKNNRKTCSLFFVFNKCYKVILGFNFLKPRITHQVFFILSLTLWKIYVLLFIILSKCRFIFKYKQKADMYKSYNINVLINLNTCCFTLFHPRFSCSKETKRDICRSRVELKMIWHEENHVRI